jgi:hypothetical protein
MKKLAAVGLGPRALCLVLLCACVPLAACGTRTGLFQKKSGSSVKDGGKKDGLAYSDGLVALDAVDDSYLIVTERGVTKVDSCLPVPASAVQGNYQGTWSGTWTCGSTAQSISGTVKFSLSPMSGDAYKMQGTMSGTASGGIPFSSSITGQMLCTSLSASLPDIIVGSGAIIYKGTGTMAGTYMTVTSPKGFKNGTFSIKESTGKCTASGTWTATHQ